MRETFEPYDGNLGRFKSALLTFIVSLPITLPVGVGVYGIFKGNSTLGDVSVHGQACGEFDLSSRHQKILGSMANAQVYADANNEDPSTVCYSGMTKEEAVWYTTGTVS